VTRCSVFPQADSPVPSIQGQTSYFSEPGFVSHPALYHRPRLLWSQHGGLQEDHGGTQTRDDHFAPSLLNFSPHQFREIRLAIKLTDTLMTAIFFFVPIFCSGFEVSKNVKRRAENLDHQYMYFQYVG
jgi:hypothetical protein